MKSNLIILIISITLLISSIKTQSEITFNVIKKLTELKINEEVIDISKLPNLNDNSKLDTLSLTRKLFPGDKITVSGSSLDLPVTGFFILSATYFDLKNNKKTFLSLRQHWICNEKPAASFGSLADEKYVQIPNVKAEYLTASILNILEFTCVGTIPTEEDDNEKLDFSTSVCTPFEYDEEKVHVPREKVVFLCNLLKKNGRTIDQEEIGEMVLSNKLVFSILDSSQTSIDLSHEVQFDYNENFLKIEFGFVKKSVFIQSVEYNDKSIILRIVQNDKDIKEDL